MEYIITTNKYFKTKNVDSIQGSYWIKKYRSYTALSVTNIFKYIQEAVTTNRQIAKANQSDKLTPLRNGGGSFANVVKSTNKKHLINEAYHQPIKVR